VSRSLAPRSRANISPRHAPLRESGAVYAFFSLESVDRRRGIATYALRVTNRTGSALVCRTWILSRNGVALPAYPEPIEIEARSDCEARVPVRLRNFPQSQWAVAEIVGPGVRCVVEASTPSKREARGTLWPLSVSAIAAGVAAVATALLLCMAMPHIAALTLPPEALSGTTVQAQYAAFGSGRLSYVVSAPNGRPLQGGRLDDRNGTFFIAVPRGVTGGAYTLRLVMESPLGSTSETRVLNALPSTKNAAWVQNVSVQPAVVAPGRTINVSYAAEGNGGYVRLIGMDGTIWGERPFSRTGETSFVVPPVPNAREMRVLVHVTQGTSSAQSMAGIVVFGNSDATPSSAPALPANAAPTDDANGTFGLMQQTVRSGDPITVRIITPHNGMQISLADMQSHEVSGTAAPVEPNAEVTLRAPSVSVPTHYTIVATFDDAFGEESVIEPLTVLPPTTP
jgi:hypothetical protein